MNPYNLAKAVSHAGTHKHYLYLIRLPTLYNTDHRNLCDPVAGVLVEIGVQDQIQSNST